MDETMIAAIVDEVIKKLESNAPVSLRTDDDCLPDLALEDVHTVMYVPDCTDHAGIMAAKESTTARIGIWRAGCRYKTATYLKLRADHALARDAVLGEVSPEFLEKTQLFTVRTGCGDKEEFLTRPDLGRMLEAGASRLISERCIKSPQAQVIVADGLSAPSVEANIPDLLPSLLQGLAQFGISAGTPLFVKYGRVGVMDEISVLLDAEVTCILIGERPGLTTAESLSAYIVYRARPGMPEAMRTVVSNIHRNGIPAVEAGAYIADLIRMILEKKVSGVMLKMTEGGIE